MTSVKRWMVWRAGWETWSAPLQRVPLEALSADAWEVQARGGEQRSFVLERTHIPASSELAERLSAAPVSPLERIVRLRTADGEPLVLETSYLPAESSHGA